jgi:hypothetical protein
MVLIQLKTKEKQQAKKMKEKQQKIRGIKQQKQKYAQLNSKSKLKTAR